MKALTAENESAAKEANAKNEEEARAAEKKAEAPVPLPIVPKGLPIVPQLEQPKAPPMPEIPISVSSPFSAAEEAKANRAKGNGDLVKDMADDAAAAAADIVKATKEARDNMIDPLPEPVSGAVADDDVPNRVMTTGGKKLIGKLREGHSLGRF